MINPHELRLGNFINCLISFGNQQILPVYGIEFDSVTVRIGEFYQKVRLEDCEPITLTPEVLEKFGFDETIAYHYEEFCFKWCPQSGYVSLFFDERALDIDFEYVHQLQTFYFALTGTELIYTP